MGYNVMITRSTAGIPADKLDEAYRRMCELNVTHHKIKRGGSFGVSVSEGESERGPGPNRWFSWMDWNYPDTCTSAQEILCELGFEVVQEHEDGPLEITGYDEKTGQEELFIETIADLFQTGSTIEWAGEDGALWQWVMSKSGLIERSGRIVYD